MTRSDAVRQARLLAERRPAEQVYVVYDPMQGEPVGQSYYVADQGDVTGGFFAGLAESAIVRSSEEQTRRPAGSAPLGDRSHDKRTPTDSPLRGPPPDCSRPRARRLRRGAG